MREGITHELEVNRFLRVWVPEWKKHIVLLNNSDYNITIRRSGPCFEVSKDEEYYIIIEDVDVGYQS